MSQDRENSLIYTPKLIRDAESEAMRISSIPQVLLMENAALAVANAVCEDAGGRAPGDMQVAILAGRGNNGADALATGRLLVRRGYNITVYEFDNGLGVFSGRQRPQGNRMDSDYNAYNDQRNWLVEYTIARQYDEKLGTIKMATLSPQIEWRQFDYIVDGLFGIGLNRNVTGVIRDTIESLNGYTKTAVMHGHEHAKVVSVDIPSGIDALTGEVCGEAVRADITVTFIGVKTGQVFYPGREYCGKRILADIGIPANVLQNAYGCVMSTPWKMKRREPSGHKGTFGKVLIIAGSDATPGAAILAAKACFRSGAGMVKVVSTQKVLTELLHELPEAIQCTREDWLADPQSQASGYNVAVVGPGLGKDRVAFELLCSVLKLKPMVHVLDADAINLLASQLRETEVFARIDELLELIGEQCILTPHPMELARLLNTDISGPTVNRLTVVNRWREAEKYRDRRDCVLVMKDATTIVVGNQAAYFNETGNDGMGTAGSGDVLAGICGAMAIDACSGYRRLDQCASQAVALHGLAGDIAAELFGRASMKAGDIIDAIPDAIQRAGTAE